MGRWLMYLTSLIRSRGLTIAIAAISPAMSSNLLEFKVGLYTPSVFFVAGAHISTMFLHHVRLQVKFCVEHHEFASEALGLCAWIVCVVEVVFLHQDHYISGRFKNGIFTY